MPPATRGRTRRKHWGYQQHHPLETSRGAVGVVNELRKKERSHPLPVRRICPFTEEAIEGLRAVQLLVVAVTTKRQLGSATQEKAEVPPSALFDAFIFYG